MKTLPRLRRSILGLATLSVLLLASACAEPQVDLDDDVPEQMEVGERRVVDVRFLRFDVEGFQQEDSLQDLREMPRRVLDDIWLLDLDISPLMVNSLQQLRALPPEDVDALPQAAQNMHRLLTMTPDNAVLMGTNLEELVALSASVGIPPAKALANLLDVGVTDDFIPPEIVADVMVDRVIGSHPAATLRRGPVDEDHPDGLYPVAPRSIPLTLGDVVTNFENLSERFGPSGEHPGFLLEAHGLSVIEEDFKMIKRVNVNALPFKGVDLTFGEVASVNSVGGQVDTLFDYSTDDWLTLEGLVQEPRVQELTFVVAENDAFIPGGLEREPVGQGSSQAWELPDWEFERIIAEMSREVAAGISAHCDAYELGTGVEAFTACIDEAGWVTLKTFNGVGSPPDPAYLWDLNLEIAQARLHDGGLSEGEADVELTVRDVPVGVSPEEIVSQVRKNIQANPEALREFATLLTNNTVGDADFFYVRSEDGRDFLYFVAPEDVRLDEDGEPVRDYAYEKPGFYADPDLQEKVSSKIEIDSDAQHEKVAVEPGELLYVGDDEGRVYEIMVAPKPSRARLSLDVTRVR